jgi:hypothetical protein
MHKRRRYDGDDLQATKKRGRFSAIGSYINSNLLNAMFAAELHARYGKDGGEAAKAAKARGEKVRE